MEKFVKYVDQLKDRGCLRFTAALCAYSLVDSLFGGDHVSYILIWQMLALCGCIPALRH